MWDDLVCPADGGPLHATRHWLSCGECGRGYPVLEGIPTFLPAAEGPAWRLAQQFRVAGLESRGAQPASRQRAAEICRRLAEYVALSARTRVLQVGLGEDGPLHVFPGGLRYAIEPLAGVLADRGRLQRGRIRWVAGRGEELPFAAGAFDVILLGRVLDSVESPERVLAETARCLARSGRVWLCCQPQRTRWRTSWERLCGREEETPAGRMRTLASRDVRRLCLSAGLTGAPCEKSDGSEDWFLQHTAPRCQPATLRLVTAAGISQPAFQPLRKAA